MFSPCSLEWFLPAQAGKNEHLSFTKNFQATTNFSLSSFQNYYKIPNPPWNLHVSLFLFCSAVPCLHSPHSMWYWIKLGVRVPNYVLNCLRRAPSNVLDGCFFVFLFCMGQHYVSFWLTHFILDHLKSVSIKLKYYAPHCTEWAGCTLERMKWVYTQPRISCFILP